jgi:hypothetical protein
MILHVAGVSPFIYDIVFGMDSFERELANVEWDLFLLYRAGLPDAARVEELWLEVDRLEGLIAGDG